MTDRLSRNSIDVLLRRLHGAGAVGISVDKLSHEQSNDLTRLVRRGDATVSFGRAFRVHRDLEPWDGGAA